MSHHVLVLGGHGKIAQILTINLLRRSWTVTSLIRSESQVADIEALGANHKGTLKVLVRSLEDVTDEQKARAILDEAGAEYVVFSAGAGGKGGPERTFRIDRDAATFFARAAGSSPSVTRFLLVSYLGSRRRAAPWWQDPASWASTEEVNRGALRHYYDAKVAADWELYRVAAARRARDEQQQQLPPFAAVDLRPGTLSNEPAGPVELGRTADSRGKVSRASVARVAELLLASDHLQSAWLDLLDGTEDPEIAVERVVRDGVDASEGEPVTSEGDAGQ